MTERATALEDLAVLAEEVNRPPEPKPSWQPVDLRTARVNAKRGDRAPTMLVRRDGTALFYRGCVNALMGESESGKSWIVLHAAAQTLLDGGVVVYLDFESDEIEVSDRLIALGVPEEVVLDPERFLYLHPEEAGEEADWAQYLDADLIVIDGITEAMDLYGLNYLDNAEYARFHAALCRPLTKGGAAVVTIDHVTKSKDTRGNYALGAGHKKAALDGCGIMVDSVQTFGREQHGWSKLTIAKDRRGYVRKHQARKGEIGVFHLNSLDDHNAEAWIDPPPGTDGAPEREEFRPTRTMEKISRFLEAIGEPQPGKSIKENVDGATDTVHAARLQLVQEGYVTQEPGKYGAVNHRLVRPFREGGDA